MATVAQVISRSFKLLGVESATDALPTIHYTNALYALNEMLGQWSIEGLLPVNTVSIDPFTLTADKTAYTIGSGEDIDEVRPSRIISAYVSDGGTDFHLNLTAKKDYDKIPAKSTTGTPRFLFYDPSYPAGTLYLYPTPDKAYVLNLAYIRAFSSYSATSETIELPDEYMAPMAYMLCIAVAPDFQREPSSAVLAMAQRYMGNLKRLHAQPVPRANAMPFSRGI